MSFRPLQPWVHMFEAVVFSLLGDGGAAEPPSLGGPGRTGNPRVGGYSGPQTQRIDTVTLLIYICGKNRT
jgi:hypothetical protein